MWLSLPRLSLRVEVKGPRPAQHSSPGSPHSRPTSRTAPFSAPRISVCPSCLPPSPESIITAVSRPLSPAPPRNVCSPKKHVFGAPPHAHATRASADLEASSAGRAMPCRRSQFPPYSQQSPALPLSQPMKLEGRGGAGATAWGGLQLLCVAYGSEWRAAPECRSRQSHARVLW